MEKDTFPIDDLKLQVVMEWLDSVMEEAELEDDSTIDELKAAIKERDSQDSE